MDVTPAETAGTPRSILDYQVPPVNSIEETIERATPILQAWPVQAAWLFGSMAKQCHHEESDVDILVEFEPKFDDTKTLLDLINLTIELQDALGRDVDLIQKKLLKPGYKENILSFLIPIIKPAA